MIESLKSRSTTMSSLHITVLRALAIVSAVAAAGCVVAPPPSVSELADARAAIVQAEQAGAEQSAPAELNAARDRFAEAQQLLPTDPQLARWRAREAESDARLAQATAQDARARLALNERYPTP
jgi:hypothetical protein